MLKRSRIHIITSDKILAAELSLNLVQMGFAISGIDKSVGLLDSNMGAKLLIIDNRNKQLEHLKTFNNVPVLYLIESAQQIPILSTKDNEALLSTPFTKERLKQQLDQLIPPTHDKRIIEPTDSNASDVPLKLEDRIFVRHKEKMVKLEIEQILYIEADRNYSRIFSKDKEYMVAITLKTMEAKLPNSVFFRIHRSYIVNLRQIDEVAETHLVISRKALPISKSLRSGLLKRLQTI